MEKDKGKNKERDKNRDEHQWFDGEGETFGDWFSERYKGRDL